MAGPTLAHPRGDLAPACPKTCDFRLLVRAGGDWLSVGTSSCRAAPAKDLDELLRPGVNPGMCVSQGIQAESSFQESVCTLAAVTFHWENKSRIKIFFSSASPL